MFSHEYSDFWLFLTQMAHFWEFQYFWSRITKSNLIFEKIFRRQNFLFIYILFFRFLPFFFSSRNTMTHVFMVQNFGTIVGFQKFLPSHFYCIFVASWFFSIFPATFFCAKMLDLFDILIICVKKNWRCWSLKISMREIEKKFFFHT